MSAKDRKIYEKVRKRDRELCVNCGSNKSVQVHHIIPRSRCGKTEEDNLLCLCIDCHLYGVHAGKISMYSILLKLSKSKNFIFEKAFEYFKGIEFKKEGYEI